MNQKKKEKKLYKFKSDFTYNLLFAGCLAIYCAKKNWRRRGRVR